MRLSAEEFAILSRLLDVGLDLPEQSREHWVNDVAEPFPGAKSLLRKMFAQEAQGDDLLSTLPKCIAGPGTVAQSAAVTRLEAGANLGVYRLVREIGHGGMGTVWLALRTDELVTRPVALKLPHIHLHDAKFADRFARERDILANLTHPNIAHLYDAGVTPQGQPFLAIEFVAGESLTQYCETHSLGLDERLGVFLQVLDAAHYAHSQSVIHRDLKPSNILVREGGHVVLLDFGIAKLLVDGEASEGELTRHGGAALTPHYASPEQIKGEALSPATDVYSLGVILYELLAGRRPYALHQSTRRALEEAILSTDPRPPSDTVSCRATDRAHASVPDTQRKALRGDLDSIVLKALKKDVADRYPTASAFAEDLRRHLRGEPVSARPDSAWYRIRKIARRHQSALQGALATAAAIGVMLALEAVWAPGRPLQDQATAQHAGRSAPSLQPNANSLAVLPFVDLSDARNNEYFSDGFSEELLNLLRGVPGLKVAARTSAFSFKGKAVDIPAAGRQLRVSNVLDGSIRKVGERLRVVASLVQVTTGNELWSKTYDGFGQDLFSLEDRIITDVAEALGIKVATRRPATKASAHVTEAHELLLQGRYFGRRNTQADRERAIDYYARAVALDPDYALAWAWLSTAYAVEAASGWTPPEAGYQRAREAAQRALQIDPNLADAHAALAYVYEHHDWDWAAADSELKRALALDPSDVRVLNMSGHLAIDTGRLAEGTSLYRLAVEADPLSSGALNGLGWCLAQSGQLAESEEVQRRVVTQTSEGVHAGIARLLLRRGHREAALAEIQLEHEPFWRLQGFVRVYDALGDHPAADRVLAKIIAQFSDHRYDIAALYGKRSDSDAAFAWLERSLDARDSGLLWIKTDDSFESLRTDPRYKALLRRMKLPE